MPFPYERLRCLGLRSIATHRNQVLRAAGMRSNGNKLNGMLIGGPHLQKFDICFYKSLWVRVLPQSGLHRIFLQSRLIIPDNIISFLFCLCGNNHIPQGECVFNIYSGIPEKRCAAIAISDKSLKSPVFEYAIDMFLYAGHKFIDLTIALL